MTQLSVQIPDELKPFMDQVISGGAYSTESDFITSLLYSVKAESERELSGEDTAKLALLREALSVGIQQIDQGQFASFDAEDIIARGRARLAEKQTAAHA